MRARAWLKRLEAELQRAGKPRQEAFWLLGRALGCSLKELPLHLDTPLDGEAEAWLEEGLKRRVEGYPLQLFLGSSEFFGLHLDVEEGVLLPRPETEELVALALQELKPLVRPRILEVGTGSGAIALALKHARPDAEIWATEISPRALALAKKNGARYGLEIHWLQASLTGGLQGFDLLIANPPYLPESYRSIAPAELAWEPEEALYAGEEGLDVARPLAQQAQEALSPGGLLLLELSPFNLPLLARELLQAGWQVSEEQDRSGALRFLKARYGTREEAQQEQRQGSKDSAAGSVGSRSQGPER